MSVSHNEVIQQSHAIHLGMCTMSRTSQCTVTLNLEMYRSVFSTGGGKKEVHAAMDLRMFAQP